MARKLLCRILSKQIGKYESSQVAGLSVRQGDHLDVTSKEPRSEVCSVATVTRIWNASPSVRGITLKIDDTNFSFKAGQWVDFMIPAVKEVGGFSMWSSPSRLVKERLIDLAVKKSSWPPAQWIHQHCKEGTEISIRVGGQFFYPPAVPLSSTHNLLLIGAGVGINPIASIVQHAAELMNLENSQQKPAKIVILHSARTSQELLFRNTIVEICEQLPDIHYESFVTREAETVSDSKKGKYHNFGRINPSILKSWVVNLGVDTVHVYLCGPPPMIAGVDKALREVGLPAERIFYEKWW